MAKMLNYTGEKRYQPQPEEFDQETGQLLYPYLPDEELIEAVNLAIFLERPLLLRGEPGCGKTRLARAVAYELKLPYKHWAIKSTSRAQDGLYTYDAVQRLHDAQLASLEKITDEEHLKRIENPESYISWGALGEAFRNEERTVVLIDEIDKADIDFPNDLLQELDEKCFDVKEFERDKRLIQAKQPPIVFITSNDEKDLPDAFLRRCVFHYITFPSKERLLEILNAHYPASFEELKGEIIEDIVAYFLELRDKMEDEKHISGKKASTSELLDWYKVLWKYAPNREILDKLSEKFWYPGVLVKNWEDYQRYVQNKDKE